MSDNENEETISGAIYALCVLSAIGIVLNTLLLLLRVQKQQKAHPTTIKVHQCITDTIWILLGVFSFLVLLHRQVDGAALCSVGGYGALFALQGLYCAVATQGFLILSWQRTNLSLTFRSIYVYFYILIISLEVFTIATLTFLPLSNLEFFTSELPFTITCIPLRLPFEPNSEYSTLLICFMWLGHTVALALIVVIYWKIYRTSSKPGYKYRRQTLKTLHISLGLDTLAATIVTITLTVGYSVLDEGGNTTIELVLAAVIALAVLVHSGVGWALHLGLPHTNCCTPETIYSDTIKSSVPKSLNSLSRLQLSPKVEDVLKVRVQWQTDQGRRLEGVMKIYQPSRRQNWSKEVRAMSKLSLMEHPNIATYLWAVNKNNFCGALEMVSGHGISQHSRVICRQYYEHGSLRDFLQLNILHNNLNSSSVFIGGSLESLTIKAVIGDFEASKEVQAQVPRLPKQRKDAVAVLYSISRYIDSLSTLEQNLYAPDVRSFGLILLEMLASLAYHRHGVKPNGTDSKDKIVTSEEHTRLEHLHTRETDGNLYERTPAKRNNPDARVADHVKAGGSDEHQPSPIPDVISSCHSPMKNTLRDYRGATRSISQQSNSQNPFHETTKSITQHSLSPNSFRDTVGSISQHSQNFTSGLPRSYSPSPSRISSASTWSSAKRRQLPKRPSQPSIIPPSQLPTNARASTATNQPSNDSPDGYTILGPPLNNSILTPPTCFKDNRSQQKRRLPNTPNSRSVMNAWDVSCDNESLAGMMNHKPLFTTKTPKMPKFLDDTNSSCTPPKLDLTPYKGPNTTHDTQSLGATSMQSRALPPIPIGIEPITETSVQTNHQSTKNLPNQKSNMIGHVNESFIPDSDLSTSETENKAMKKHKTPSKLKNIARNRDPVYSAARHDQSCSDDSFSLLNSFVSKSIRGNDTSTASDDSGLGTSSQGTISISKLDNIIHTADDHSVHNLSKHTDEHNSVTTAMAKIEPQINLPNRTRNNESFDSTKCDTIYETITPAAIQKNATMHESDTNSQNTSKIFESTGDEPKINTDAIIASTPHKIKETNNPVATEASTSQSDHCNTFDTTQNTSIWSPGSSNWTPSRSQGSETLELTCVTPRTETPLSDIYEHIAGSATPFTEIPMADETLSSLNQTAVKYQQSPITDDIQQSPIGYKSPIGNISNTQSNIMHEDVINDTFENISDANLEITDTPSAKVGVSRRLQFRKRSARYSSQNDLNKSLLEALGLIEKTTTAEDIKLIFDDSALLNGTTIETDIGLNESFDMSLDFELEDPEKKMLNKSFEIAVGLKTPGTPAKSSDQNTELNKSFELAIGLRTPGTIDKPLVQNNRQSLFQPYDTTSRENAYMSSGGPSVTKTKRSKRRLLPDLNAIVKDDTPDDIKRTISLHKTRYREMAVDSFFINDPSISSQTLDNLSGIISHTDASTVNSLIIDTDIMISRLLTPDDALSMFSMKSTCVDSVTNYDATITPIKTDNMNAIAAKLTPSQAMPTKLKSIQEKEPTTPERPPKPSKRRNMLVLPLQVQNALAQSAIGELAVGIEDYHQIYCERLHHTFPLLDTRALLSRDTGHLDVIMGLLKVHGKLGFIGNQISALILECWTSDSAPSARDILSKLRRSLPSSPV
ncbi:unnamed protein product [Owenia fusiformis]|uniref:Uncharacterized protein n=1 Tax=Owenia fusiformis TaxID=6347 RepID=A0A8J1XWQ5_OWEFU|nr:unnamed protein product [Owenia fusiformis]